MNGQAIDITGDTIGNDYVSISDPYELTETVLNTSTLRFNFAPDNAGADAVQRHRQLHGDRDDAKGRQSASTSLPLRIWNGCDVGIEPWDKKILRNGPLCGERPVLQQLLIDRVYGQRGRGGPSPCREA